LALLSHCKS